MKIFLDKRKNAALHSSMAATGRPTVEPSKSLTLIWGATGEQDWTPALTTGKLIHAHTHTHSITFTLTFNTKNLNGYC